MKPNTLGLIPTNVEALFPMGSVSSATELHPATPPTGVSQHESAPSWLGTWERSTSCLHNGPPLPGVFIRALTSTRPWPSAAGELSLERRHNIDTMLAAAPGRSGDAPPQQHPTAQPPAMAQKARTVVLITGCSSGIGMHLALRLASDPSGNFKVYATMRDLRDQGPLWEAARSRGCPPGALETLQLDVRDAHSVAAAQAQVTEGHVDVLVCNAGRGVLGPLEGLAASTVASVLDVNLVGTVRTLQAFLPDMKRRHAGRILVTGSLGGLMGMPFNHIYCASKFALEGLCESLAIELLTFGIHVSLVVCGPVRTAFLEKMEGVPGGALDGVDAKTRALFSHYQRHFQDVFREISQEPDEVAEVFVEALRDPRPALRYFSTESFLPWTRRLLDDPSGRCFVAAAHRHFFQGQQDDPGEEAAGARAQAGPCAPSAAAAQK